MSQSSRLLAGIQKKHAAEFPGTVAIDGQSYACGVTGLRRGTELDAGGAGFTAIREISFLLAADAFDVAGQPVPTAPQAVECTAPAAYVGSYRIVTVHPSPGGNVLVLQCQAPPQ